MSQTAEAIVRRLIDEGFNQGRLDVADELISPQLVEHQNFGPDHAPGAEGVKAVIASLATVVSEGIESESELSCLMDLAVGCGQGFYLARPGLGRVDSDVPELVAG